MSDPPLLEVEDLTVQYQTGEGRLTAVSDVSLTIREGEYFGVVGESGCGKSTLILSILRALDSNGEITDGTIRYRGRDLGAMSERELNREIRWTEISYIPQGSMNSLDPLERISDQAVDLANVHTEMTKREAIEKIQDLLEVVGIDPERVHDYPHQFSGGMKQRVIIAFAFFLDPSLIVADEPTTALDVIMQDQIFKYLDGIIEAGNTSMLLITHDIAVVFESCDRMGVMHGGQMMELGTVRQVDKSPMHPYSILLQDAFPDIRHPDRELGIIEGQPPEQYGAVDYCTFADRCPWAGPECREMAPPLEPRGDDARLVSCFKTDEVRKDRPGEAATAESGEGGERR